MCKLCLYTFRAGMTSLLSMSVTGAIYSWLSLSREDVTLCSTVTAITLVIGIIFWIKMERDFKRAVEIRQEIDRLFENMRTVVSRNNND